MCHFCSLSRFCISAFVALHALEARQARKGILLSRRRWSCKMLCGRCAEASKPHVRV